MKQRFLIAISSLLVLTGCGSSEMSPEEKRNKFDKCVLDNYKYQQNIRGEDVGKLQAELKCKDLLD